MAKHVNRVVLVAMLNIKYCSLKDYEYTNELNLRHTGAIAAYLSLKMGFKTVYLAGFDYYKNREGKDHLYLKDDNNKYSEKRIKLFLDDFEKFNTDNLCNLNDNSRFKKCSFSNINVIYEN